MIDVSLQVIGRNRPRGASRFDILTSPPPNGKRQPQSSDFDCRGSHDANHLSHLGFRLDSSIRQHIDIMFRAQQNPFDEAVGE